MNKLKIVKWALSLFLIIYGVAIWESVIWIMRPTNPLIPLWGKIVYWGFYGGIPLFIALGGILLYLIIEEDL